MAQVIIEDLDPAVLEKLEALAKEHGRSLQAELKYILESAAQSEIANLPEQWEAIRKKADLMRQQIINHAACQGIELKPTEKKSEMSDVIEGFRTLRGKILPGDIYIREMREEGRRI